jgi:hypothetical protein
MRRLIVMTLALIAVTVACAVPSSGNFEAIHHADIPYDLANTSTSSTFAPTTAVPATTSAPVTTAAPATTVVAPSTTEAPTSTSVSTELVDLYFAAGSQLNTASVVLSRPASATQVLAALVAGPRELGDAGKGLRAIIPSDAQLTVDLRGGVATVDLPVDIFDGMSSPDQRLMFGQIVLTLTSGVPRTGQVAFTLDGEPLRVFLGSGDITEPGAAVSYDQYTALLEGGSTPPPVTTSTIATITTTRAATTVATTSTPDGAETTTVAP